MIRTLLELLGWNTVFLSGIVAIAIYGGSSAGDALAFTLPFVLGLWLLVLGVRFTRGRGTVIATAALASLAFVAQALLLAFFAWFSDGFGNAERGSDFRGGGVVAASLGLFAVWAFLAFKLPRREAGR
jgi:hypothetical protein